MWRWAPAVLAAGALAALTLAIAVDGDDPPARPAPPPPPPRADALLYPAQGLRLARPQGWTAESRDGVIRLRAPAELGVAIVTAPREQSPARLMRDLVAGLRPAARSVEVLDSSETRLGDLGARSERVEVTGRDGRQSEVVVLAARSRWRTYGVTVFNSTGDPVSTSPAVADILDSFEFSRPR